MKQSRLKKMAAGSDLGCELSNGPVIFMAAVSGGATISGRKRLRRWNRPWDRYFCGRQPWQRLSSLRRWDCHLLQAFHSIIPSVASGVVRR